MRVLRDLSRYQIDGQIDRLKLKTQILQFQEYARQVTIKMDPWNTVHSVWITLSVMKGLTSVLNVHREQQTLNILHAVSLQLLFKSLEGSLDV